MKRVLICFSVLLVLFSVRTSPVHAFGVGLFADFDGGKMIWDGYGAEFMNYGGGFVMDTNLASDQVFNYRLEFSFSNLRTPYNAEEIDILSTMLAWSLLGTPLIINKTVTKHENSLLMSTVHYFGFGVVRSKSVRFWLGPQLTIGGMLTNLTGLYTGFGFAMGLNFNIGDVFTLAFTGSGRFLGGARFYTYNGVTYTTGGYGGDGMVTVAFIFRVPGDTYKASR
ncbi:MAG: hypothetical protein JW807_15990 [Spirochaetes bacterium]|nr:hypothetical protein [Spirochaetota bacterium]